MTFQAYAALMQAMLDLNETPDLYPVIRRYPVMPYVRFTRLQEEQTKLLTVPSERSIDDVLKHFKQKVLGYDTLSLQKRRAL